MDTKLVHLSQVPISTGLPESLDDPIKPELFRGFHEGRLGALVGVTQFGANHVTLEPGSASALRHWHEAEDEFVYVLSGELTLVDDNGEHALTEGSFAGFPTGCPNAHHLQNRSEWPASFIVVGSRKPGASTLHYPNDDLGPARRQGHWRPSIAPGRASQNPRRATSGEFALRGWVSSEGLPLTQRFGTSYTRCITRSPGTTREGFSRRTGLARGPVAKNGRPEPNTTGTRLTTTWSMRPSRSA